MRVIIQCYSDAEDIFRNLEVTKMVNTEDNLLIYNGNELVGFFGINDVKAAWLSSKK